MADDSSNMNWMFPDFTSSFGEGNFLPSGDDLKSGLTGNPTGFATSGLGSLMMGMPPGMSGMLKGLFGGQQMPNPADSAMPYLNQIPGMMTPYYSPYIQAGAGALPTLQGQYANWLSQQGDLQKQYGSMTSMLPALQGQYGQMINDPSSVINRIGAGFKQSPGYQFQVDSSLNAANRAAAAGGSLGSVGERLGVAGTVNNLANQDYYNYLSHGENMYSQGLQGETNLYNRGLSGEEGGYNQGLQGERGLNQMGYGASNELAENLASALMTQGNLAYAGQADQNQATQGQNGMMAGMGMSAISALLPYLISAL